VQFIRPDRSRVANCRRGCCQLGIRGSQATGDDDRPFSTVQRPHGILISRQNALFKMTIAEISTAVWRKNSSRRISATPISSADNSSHGEVREGGVLSNGSNLGKIDHRISGTAIQARNLFPARRFLPPFSGIPTDQKSLFFRCFNGRQPCIGDNSQCRAAAVGPNDASTTLVCSSPSSFLTNSLYGNSSHSMRDRLSSAPSRSS